MTRVRQVLLFSLPFLFFSPIIAQTAPEQPVVSGITDEMTVNPEQNQLWRTGQGK